MKNTNKINFNFENSFNASNNINKQTDVFLGKKKKNKKHLNKINKLKNNLNNKNRTSEYYLEFISLNKNKENNIDLSLSNISKINELCNNICEKSHNSFFSQRQGNDFINSFSIIKKNYENKHCINNNRLNINNQKDINNKIKKSLKDNKSKTIAKKFTVYKNPVTKNIRSINKDNKLSKFNKLKKKTKNMNFINKKDIKECDLLSQDFYSIYLDNDKSGYFSFNSENDTFSNANCSEILNRGFVLENSFLGLENNLNNHFNENTLASSFDLITNTNNNIYDVNVPESNVPYLNNTIDLSTYIFR